MTERLLNMWQGISKMARTTAELHTLLVLASSCDSLLCNNHFKQELQQDGSGRQA